MKTNPELQKSKMKSYAEKRGVNPNSINFQRLLESDLTEEENWEVFKKEVAERTGAKTVEELEEEMGMDYEIPEERTVKDFYRNFTREIKMVAQGYHNSMLVNSPPGIGKTYQINKTLEETVGEDGFVRLSGHITPLKLYITLYENKDKTVFLDDAEGLVSNDTALSTLKQATADEDTRKVMWTSSTSRLETNDGREIDESFTFTGQVIMCFNEVPDGRHFEAVRNRALYHELDFDYEERKKLLLKVAEEHEESNLSQEERLEVARWIIRNTTPAYNGVNLRTLITAFNRREFSEEHWEEMAMKSLHERSDLAKVMELQNKYEDVEKQAEEFSKSRRTFYRKKKELQRRAGEL